MNLLPSRCRNATAALLAAAAALGSACSASESVGTSAANQDGQGPSIEITHEPCDLTSNSAIKMDVNNDGRSDITRVMEGARETCRALDLNFDRKIDSFLYFDEAGNLRRRESDFDRDGVLDEIAFYKAGRIQRKERETNLDGKLDTWDDFNDDKIVKRARDTNADGKIDQWWTFPTPGKTECPVVATDEDGDGRPDAQHDICKDRDAELTAQQQPAPPPATSPQDAAAPQGDAARAGEESSANQDGGS